MGNGKIIEVDTDKGLVIDKVSYKATNWTLPDNIIEYSNVFTYFINNSTTDTHLLITTNISSAANQMLSIIIDGLSELLQ